MQPGNCGDTILHAEATVSFHRNHLQVIRNDDASVEVACSFFGIVLTAGREVAVLGMIEQQIADVQGSGKLTGFKCRTVMLLVGLEDFTVAVEAEGFAQQPVGSLHTGTVGSIERLVTQTGQTDAAGKPGTETELFLLG